MDDIDYQNGKTIIRVTVESVAGTSGAMIATKPWKAVCRTFIWTNNLSSVASIKLSIKEATIALEFLPEGITYENQ